MACGRETAIHEDRCESKYEQSADGCCANGRRCDDLCIEIAAALMCQQSADHSTEADKDNVCEDACCAQSFHVDEGAQALKHDADSCCGDSIRDSAAVDPCMDSCCGAEKSEVETTSCAEGCCGDAEELVIEEDKCQMSCCSEVKQVELKGSGSQNVCCDDLAKVEIEQDCQKECCGETKSDAATESCEDACCDEKPLAKAANQDIKHEYKKACYDQNTAQSGNLQFEICGCGPAENIPAESSGSLTAHEKSCKQEEGRSRSNVACCATKSCHETNQKLEPVKETNVSCCEKDTCQSVGNSTSDLSSGLDELKTCSAHLEAAKLKFTAFIEAGLCICRSIMPRGDVCCNEKKRGAIVRARYQRKQRELSKAAAPTTFMFSDESLCLQTRKVASVCQKKSCRTESPAAQYKMGQKAPALWAAVEQPKLPTEATSSDVKVHVKEADVEQAAVHEHITFNIAGMTCTGCVKKVVGVFNHVPGVFNVNVNYVAGKAECDVDPQFITANQALNQLERETGFKCTRTFSTTLTLDVLMPKEAAQRLENAKLDGVMSIDCIGKELYEISFDPAVVGARKLLSNTNGRLALPRKDTVLASGQRALVSKLLSFIVATVMTIPVVVFAWGDPPISYNKKSIASMVLATGVQLVSVPEFYIPALKALIFSKSIEMDMLVVISISAAYVYSVVAFGLTHAGYTLQEGEFFETSTLLVSLVLLGRLVSTFAKLRAVSAVSLRSLQAHTAYLEQGDSEPVELDARLLEYNDVIVIPPHSQVVTDGRVIQGSSAVDESMVTGESIPVSKSEGSFVIAGTINGIGPLRVRATRLPGQNSISDIANLVSNALSTKPKLQDLADVVAGYFVPVVVVIAVVVLIVWLVISTKIRHENAGGAVGTAITYAIAVLAISCPCALGLAVPMVMVVAGGVAAKSGIIIKSASATERSFKTTDVVFDKTGTLTFGDLQVFHEEVRSDHSLRSDVLGLAYSLVQDNEHPVSTALAAHLRGKKVSSVKLKDVESIPGCGIAATWNGQFVKAGNPSWLNVSTHPDVTKLQSRGLTLLCIILNDELIATFGLQASTRPEAGLVIGRLQSQGIKCHIVSGDNTAAVRSLAQSLQIPEDNIAAQKKPEEKLAYIKALQASTNGKKRNCKVLFVGDGTNDAAAIAQADFGLQIGDTSDISRAAADVVLLGGLDGVITLLEVSKAAFVRITFNFVWSGVYNVIAILLASGAFVKFRVPPAYAGLGEIVSVLPVIVVGLSMTMMKFGRTNSAH